MQITWLWLVGCGWWRLAGWPLAGGERSAWTGGWRCLRARAGINSGARLLLLGGADEAGVVAAQDEGADAAAVLAGGESDQALLEVAGHGVTVARAGVPGGGVITW